MAKIYQMEETSRFNDFSQRIRGGVLLLSTLSFGLCVKLSEVWNLLTKINSTLLWSHKKMLFLEGDTKKPHIQA